MSNSYAEPKVVLESNTDCGGYRGTNPNSLPSLVKHQNHDLRGLLIALCILAIWAVNLFVLLRLDLSNITELEILMAILGQTFIYTGLFITAHDAMHGAILPQNPKINHLIGKIAVWAYGLFSYQELFKKHWLHHGHPASHTDPDYHDGKHKNFIAWYFHFMQEYWSWRRLIGLAFVFHGSNLFLDIPENNLFFFWLFPAILSSLQLFYFGTFLPHREPPNGYQTPHRCQSLPFPVFLSFLTCYHFGYHEEHHQYPHLPWWQLPTARKQTVRSS